MSEIPGTSGTSETPKVSEITGTRKGSEMTGTLEISCPHMRRDEGKVVVSEESERFTGFTGFIGFTEFTGFKGEMGHSPIPPHDSRNMMPSDLDVPVEGMSGERVSSSIPRADTEAETTWLYPSPRMFYNAMQRKGHKAHAEDMPLVVTIHNIVNEQTWQEILRWENYYHPGGQPKLRRFLGRPDTLSPRALFRSWFLGCSRPFDRHDWYIERLDGSEARYVIDFYSGSTKNDLLNPSFHIDARPALDTPQAIYTRAHYAMNKFVYNLQDRLSKCWMMDVVRWRSRPD